MATQLELFTAGHQRQRGDDEYVQPAMSASAPNGVVKGYWLADKFVWWKPETSWAVYDRALGAVALSGFTNHVDALFTEVQRMWGLLVPVYPTAVWDPFTWKWMVARAVPTPQPGPAPGQPPPSGGTPDKTAARRAERDRRIAEVNALYDARSISREVRDERIGEILEDYPELN